MKVIITESQYERLKNEMATITPKDDTAKWIKCKNCKVFGTTELINLNQNNNNKEN